MGRSASRRCRSTASRPSGNTGGRRNVARTISNPLAATAPRLKNGVPATKRYPPRSFATTLPGAVSVARLCDDARRRPPRANAPANRLRRDNGLMIDVLRRKHSAKGAAEEARNGSRTARDRPVLLEGGRDLDLPRNQRRAARRRISSSKLK